MNLIEQILAELGADTVKSFTVVPGYGGYFRNVKTVAEFSPDKVTLVLRRGAIILEGEGLEVAKYFEEDALIKGDIRLIKVE